MVRPSKCIVAPDRGKDNAQVDPAIIVAVWSLCSQNHSILYHLLALEIVLLQGIMQPGKDPTMPRPKIHPLLFGHSGGEHVQPPAHDQVGISSLFPLEVRSGFMDHKELGQ